MGKNILSNLLIVLLLSASIVACDKSSFKIREGSESDITTTEQTTVQTETVDPNETCQTDCDTTVVYQPVDEPYIDEPTEVYQPVAEIPVVSQPVNDPHACNNENEIFGSAAYIIQGQNSLELLWNYFEARGPADPKVAYYQVVVMDSRMNEAGTFKSKYITNNGYLVHPGAVDINGKRLDSKIDFKYGNWYWYKLIALDKNYNVVSNHANNPHIRKFDIGMNGDFKKFYRISGYCGNN